MRYKALARKFRQAVGICDPIPAASVLPKMDDKVKSDAEERHNREASGNIVGTPLKNENVPIDDEKNKNDNSFAMAKSVENMVRLCICQLKMLKNRFYGSHPLSLSGF
jgi:hypothetical protein